MKFCKYVKAFIAVSLLSFLIMFSACSVTTSDIDNTADTTATTATTRYQYVDPYALYMPDKIVIDTCLAGDKVVVPLDENHILFYYMEETKVVTLTNEEILVLNELYRSITDYSNLDGFENDPDTTFYHNGEVYEFNSIMTTQIELEQYVNLVNSYYFEVEYDWSVMEIEGYER